MRPSTPIAADTVYLDYLIVERPAGDSYLDRRMWDELDEMAIPVDSRPFTRSNGFRIGVVGGLLSQDIQTLIAKNQSEIRRRQSSLGVGKPLPIGQATAIAEFSVTLPDVDQPKSFKLEQAQAALNITAWEGEGGKVRVGFVPEISYHDRKHWIPPGAVGAGWLREKPLERFGDLGWEVSLSPSEYVLIGTQFESEGTLGHRFFMGETKNQKVQRLLILRVGKINQSLPLGEFFSEDSLRKSEKSAIPLALQASQR